MKNFTLALYMIIGSTILLLLIMPYEICCEIAFRREQRRCLKGRK